VIKRWLAAFAILALFVGLLFCLVPKTSDLAEVEVRAADVQQAVQLLEHQVQAQPQDLGLKEHLATACEHADRPGEALKVLQELAGHKVLSPEQRTQVRRLALADARPARAFAILSDPHQPRGARELSELVALAVSSHHPAEALSYQTQLLALRPDSTRELAKLSALAENAQQSNPSQASDPVRHSFGRHASSADGPFEIRAAA
jgi:hypothetical protein